jgi:rubrerythrin
MLTDRGFKKVINMAGGIKAWNGNKAVGPEDTGLYLFTGAETLPQVLIVAYSLEKGLQDFYLSMTERVSGAAVKNLFEKLAGIETFHQERLLTEYCRETGTELSKEEFETTRVVGAMEGGLTTEQYLELYEPDLENETEVVSLAMAIEAQALDLYQRTADMTKAENVRLALMRIADEERAHLKQLAGLLD